jgi:hypothetical protein
MALLELVGYEFKPATKEDKAAKKGAAPKAGEEKPGAGKDAAKK